MAGRMSAPNMLCVCVCMDMCVCLCREERMATLVLRSVTSGRHAHVRGFQNRHLPHRALLSIAVTRFNKTGWKLQMLLTTVIWMNCRHLIIMISFYDISSSTVGFSFTV